MNATRMLFSAFRAKFLRDLSNNRTQRTLMPFFSQKPKPVSLTDIFKGLQDQRNLIFRGSTGHAEIKHIMTTNYIAPSYHENEKLESIDLLAHIEKNDRKPFLSAAPCPYAALPYAVGFPMLPSHGYIIVMSLPRVYTRPQMLLHLDPEQCKRYDQQTIMNSSLADGMIGGDKHRSIIRTAERNNEVSIVLYANENIDWRSTADSDIFKVIQLHTPGKIIGSVRTSKEQFYTNIWTNKSFEQRAFAIEIVCSAIEDLDKISKRAINLRIIEKGHRVLHLEDAKAVDKSPELELFDVSLTGGTHEFMSVPESISLGDRDALIGYMCDTLEDIAKRRERELVGSDKPIFTEAY